MNRRSRQGRRKNAEDGNGGDNGEQESLDLDTELDLIQQRTRKRYPIIPFDQKAMSTHNLATLPSLKTEDGSVVVGEHSSAHVHDEHEHKRTKVAHRMNANSLIESRNKYRQLLVQIQAKHKPNSNTTVPKPDTNFEGYNLKPRKVKLDAKKHGKNGDNPNGNNQTKQMDCEYQVFGRKIDLSGFSNRNGSSNYVPMYPLCRLWAMSDYNVPDSLVTKRKPPAAAQPAKDEVIDFDGPYSDQPVDVYRLPRPEPLPIDEQGNPICLRIPESVRNFQPPKGLKVDQILNTDPEKSAEELLKVHKDRWRSVRKEFQEAAKQNDKRYSHSFSILRSMHSK